MVLLSQDVRRVLAHYSTKLAYVFGEYDLFYKQNRSITITFRLNENSYANARISFVNGQWCSLVDGKRTYKYQSYKSLQYTYKSKITKLIALNDVIIDEFLRVPGQISQVDIWNLFWDGCLRSKYEFYGLEDDVLIDLSPNGFRSVHMICRWNDQLLQLYKFPRHLCFETMSFKEMERAIVFLLGYTKDHPILRQLAIYLGLEWRPLESLYSSVTTHILLYIKHPETFEDDIKTFRHLKFTSDQPLLSYQCSNPKVFLFPRNKVKVLLNEKCSRLYVDYLLFAIYFE